MGRRARLLQSPLRAFADDWPAGPGRTRPLARIGAWARWDTVESIDGFSYEDTYLGQPSIFALELPFSVIPHSIRTHGRIRGTELASPVVEPVPTWRGIPCKWGQARLWLRNNLRPSRHSDAWMPFTVLALLPDRDPPGPPPPDILLGAQFFIHHSQLVLVHRYGDIEFDDTHRPLPYNDCGELLA